MVAQNNNNKTLSALLSKPIVEPRRTLLNKTVHSINNVSLTNISDKKLELLKQIFEMSSLQSKSILTPKNIPFKKYHNLNLNWDLDNQQLPILASNDQKTICIHPFSQGYFETHSVRANKPLRLNAYTYWEFRIPAGGLPSGTSAMIGLCSKQTELISLGYADLLGADKSSWGLSLTSGHLKHDNQLNSGVYCEPICGRDDEETTIGCLFDGYKGRLAFYLNGLFKGVAFENMMNHINCELYPAVSSTVSNSIFTIQNSFESFPTLQELCASMIQRNGSFYNALSEDLAFYERFLHFKN
jgi:hypothetical protein